jgi:hypothetical protein
MMNIWGPREYGAEICICMLLKFSIFRQWKEREKSGGEKSQWTTSHSSFVQTYLANLVSERKKMFYIL